MPIQLIYTDISDIILNKEEEDKLTRIIPAYFQDKIRASKNDTLKLQRLASGLLFSYIMKKMGYEPGETEIAEEPQGKPVIIKPEDIYFNLSHSEGLVLLAVSDAGVGCDIQKIKNGERIAERFFTEDEKRALNEADVIGRDRLFTRFWARKESYIKASGEGMKRDMRSFSVLDDVTSDGYIFADFDFEDYCAAACVCCKDKSHGKLRGECDICLIPFQNLTDVVLSY